MKSFAYPLWLINLHCPLTAPKPEAPLHATRSTTRVQTQDLPDPEDLNIIVCLKKTSLSCEATLSEQFLGSHSHRWKELRRRWSTRTALARAELKLLCSCKSLQECFQVALWSLWVIFLSTFFCFVLLFSYGSKESIVMVICKQCICHLHSSMCNWIQSFLWRKKRQTGFVFFSAFHSTLIHCKINSWG